MSSRERRLLDKDKEIRKLKNTAGHYFTATIDGAIKIHKLEKELERTRKALEIAVDALKVLKPEKAKGGGYWGFKSTDVIKLINKALEQITALEQKDVK